MSEAYNSGAPQPEFNKFFEGPYGELDTVVQTLVQDNQRIIDIGAGAGTVEKRIEETKEGCQIVCVDLSEKALQELKRTEFTKNQVMPLVEDANVFLSANNAKDVDVVIVNATLHEINDFENREKYLDSFFQNIRKMLKVGSKLIIGDFIYPSNSSPDAPEEERSVTDEEVERFKEYQQSTINHADDRIKFVDPKLVKQKAAEHGFNLVDEANIKAEPDESPVGDINRRYYLLTFEMGQAE
jgi:SAM-dependent methyltransferase